MLAVMRCWALGILVLVACTPARDRGATGPGPDAPSQAPQGSGWTAGAAVVEVGSVAGRADFRRLLRYTRANSRLEIEDSDPFATGQESPTPRVLKLGRTLSSEESRRVEEILANVRPDGDALARRCAPGGCLWLERIFADGDRARLEDFKTVQGVLADLTGFFPEARK